MTIDDLAAGNYISLATFKRDGTRVATPVWVMRDGEHLYVITDANSGKAKRLRNSSRAEVAPCDVRGNVTGDTVACTAELLDEDGTAKVEKLTYGKYGLMARMFTTMNWIRSTLTRQHSDRVGIEITLD